MSSLEHSAIYQGWIRHRRFCTPENHFHYQFYMFYLDLDELDAFNDMPFCSTQGFSAFMVKNSDYLDRNSSASIKEKAIAKTLELGGEEPTSVRMLANIRYWGMKFSPITVFYNYDSNEQLINMLVEVSNTPWNQRHYYLIDDPESPAPTKKSFHVSPFQISDVEYRWRLKEPKRQLLLHIENQTLNDDPTKLFDATLQLQRKPITVDNLKQTLIQTPVMSLKIVSGIYWQAAKLAAKRARFYSHPKTTKTGEPHV